MSNLVFSRPQLPALISRIYTALSTALPGLTPQLRRSVVRIVATVLGQEIIQLFAYIDNFAAWFFVQTSEGIYLDRKGIPLGVLRLPGGYASGPVAFAGLNGYSAPAGSVLQSQDGSLSYTLNATVEIAGGTAAGTVTCTTVGSAGTLVPGAILTLATAVPGINANVTVSGAGTPGVDAEQDELYKARILARQQMPPQGGAGADYIAWLKTVPGVTRVFVWPLGLAGTSAGCVTVAPLFDGRASPIPLAADLTACSAALATVAPVTATVTPIAVTEDNIPVTIQGLTAANGYTVAQAEVNIAASLAALSAATTAGGATFGDGIPWGTVGGDLNLDDISEAIKQSLGVGEFTLVAPSANIASASGHLAVLAAPTFE